MTAHFDNTTSMDPGWANIGAAIFGAVPYRQAIIENLSL